MVHRAQCIFPCFSGSLVILFMLADCGPTEMIKHNMSICLQIREKTPVIRQCSAADRVCSGRRRGGTGHYGETQRYANHDQGGLGRLRTATTTWSTEA